MVTVNPYLTFDGNAEEAFKFYKAVFGGDLMMMRFKDSPEAGKTAAADLDKLMHVSLPLSKENALMASDVVGPMAEGFTQGNNIALSVNASDEKDADRIYAGLSAGGQATMTMQKTFWGAYFGMLVDKFGIHWMVSVQEPPKD